MRADLFQSTMPSLQETIRRAVVQGRSSPLHVCHLGRYEFRQFGYKLWYPEGLLNLILERGGIDREEDLELVVLAAPFAGPQLLGIAILPSSLPRPVYPSTLRWQQLWEVEAGDGLKKLVATPSDQGEQRPDTWEEPRQEYLQGAPYGFGHVGILRRMVILGIDDVVIPTCAEGPPPPGMATQIELWFPQIEQLRRHRDVRPGTVVTCVVGRPGREALVYLPITRVHGRDLENPVLATDGLIRVLGDAKRRGRRCLVLHRPPAANVLNWFEASVVMQRLLPLGMSAMLCPGVTKFSARWMPQPWQSPLDRGLKIGDYVDVL